MVCLIFRKKIDIYFSIEKIFDALAIEIARQMPLKKVYAPHVRLLPQNVLANLFFIRKIKGDLFHITGDTHYLALGLPGKKTVLTIHDCGFMYQSTGFKRMILKKMFLTWPVNRCQVITTISEQIKTEIIKFTGCHPGKIVVIRNPVSDRIVYTKREFNRSCPCLLFIGTTENKNLSKVAEALKGINCTLSIIGIVSDELKEKMTRDNIRFRTFFQLSEAELSEKYSSADILIFPSTYEGFGLPIVEAQKAGRAVITSNISPMKEVAGEGACLVDPFSVGSIRKGLMEVVENDEYRESIISKGFINVEQFLIKNVAQEYINVYKQIKN